MDHWMFNCKDVTRMVSDSMDRNLPFFQRMGIRIHLMMCKLCSRYRRQLYLIRKTVQLYTLHGEDRDLSITLPPAAKGRIKEVLNKEIP